MGIKVNKIGEFVEDLVKDGGVIDDFEEFAKKNVKTLKKLKPDSNEPITRAWEERGIHGVFHNYKTGGATAGDLGKSVTRAFTTGEGDSTKLALGTIAGSYIGTSSAYRVASGGGLYKDKNGNANIIGLPFI
jgi:hypothetical protein